MESKFGYIISVVVGCIASSIVNAGLGLAGILGGLMFIMLSGLIISGIISIFYKNNFQKIFTIVCIIVSVLAALGASGVRIG